MITRNLLLITAGAERVKKFTDVYKYQIFMALTSFGDSGLFTE